MSHPVMKMTIDKCTCMEFGHENMHPPISTSPARHWVFAAFVLGQMHPLRDGPCTSPYAAAVMRRVVLKLGKIEDLCCLTRLGVAFVRCKQNCMNHTEKTAEPMV